MLPRLAPHASSPEVLDLSGSKLGCDITADIAVLAKLKMLNMPGMNLEGTGRLGK